GIVGLVMGEVLFAGEEADERATPLRAVVAHRAAQRRVGRLQGVEHGGLGDGRVQIEQHLATRDMRQVPQVRWQYDADHDSVCASTESTDGRSRTIGSQLSPASFEA